MDWQREWGKDKGGIMELNYTIYRYDADRNAVIMTDMDGRELVIECDKGGKLRRLFIPKILREETLKWLCETQRTSGYLFLNRYGDRITTRGISQQLKNYADKYGLDSKVVYPHSFRHRYAKNFLEKYNDIALLADLMGHESIETTRIYLRRTASEQQALVDKIVTW